MNELRICFTGIGSIAKRHIRNLREIESDRGIKFHIDAFRRNSTLVEGVDKVYHNLKAVPNDYDIVFITNPTELHLDTLCAFHDKGKHFFIEKPLVSLSQIEAARQFQIRENTVYYVACPLRYHAVIQWIRTHVNPSDVISIRSMSSSYLPDWRPGRDYRETYSAHRDLGGGVSIDLIHEWDYLTYLFGWPERVQSLIGKKSDLEIDSDDYAVYIAEYNDKIVELHLDYFGRKVIREIQLFTKDETIIGDIANQRVRFLVQDNEIRFNENRDDYQQRELNYFLDIIEGHRSDDSSFEHAVNVLELTQGRI